MSADVPEGKAFDAWRLPALTRDAFDALGPRDQLEYLASLALLAPTTHNTVPQRMRVDAESRSLRFALDRRAILLQSDASGRQATISLGAAMANAALGARAYGWSAALRIEAASEKHIRPATDGEQDVVEVASLIFTPGSPRDERLIAAMLRRKMVRAEYDERVKLEPALMTELAGIAGSVHPELTLHLITDAPTLLALGKFQELADSTVINREGFARELGDWLLANDSDAVLGMRGREFGLSDAAAARLRDGLAGRGPLLPDEAASFAKAGNIGIRSSSAVAVITVAKDDLEQRLAAGRAYEEMALRLVLDDVVVAMHAGITEVEAPNMALRGRLRTFKRPTVVFRIGKPLVSADGERPHASRPALEDVLY